MITIATDCSGIEAPLIALDLLKVNYKHKFASDNNNNAKQFILQNFKPDIFYDDIKTRDNKSWKNKSLDFYISLPDL